MKTLAGVVIYSLFFLRAVAPCAALDLSPASLAVPVKAQTSPRSAGQSITPPPAPVQPPSFLSNLVMRYLPEHLTATQDKDQAQNQIRENVTKKISQDLINDFSFPHSNIARWVSGVHKYASPTMNIVGPSNGGGPIPLKFQIEAERGRASLNYSGLVESAFSYVASSGNLEWTLSKKLSSSTFLELKEQSPMSGIDVAHLLQLGCTF